MRTDTPWVIFMDVAVLDKYLDYPGSPFASPTRIHVSYHTHSEELTSDKPYEDLWFKNGRAIGMHRICQGLMPLKWDGIIYVRPSSFIERCPADVADAAVRIVLDVYLLGAQLRGVCVPKQYFKLVGDQLPNYNFTKTLTGGGDVKVMLRLLSDPPEYESYFVYNNGNS